MILLTVALCQSDLVQAIHAPQSKESEVLNRTLEDEQIVTDKLNITLTINTEDRQAKLNNNSNVNMDDMFNKTNNDKE